LALAGGFIFRLLVARAALRRLTAPALVAAFDGRGRRFGLLICAAVILAMLLGILVQAANAANVAIWEAAGAPFVRLLGTQVGTVWLARLGCVAVGYTIYPGTMDRRLQYEQLQELTLEAKSAGLAVVVWSYPRGGVLSKAGETGVDVTGYAAQIAAQLGAHIIKIKLSTDHIEQAEAKKVYDKYQIPISTLTDRVRHMTQAAFGGRRIVIFSGGATKDDANAVLDEARAIRDGGGFGSIIGRNAFQRQKPDALKLLGDIMKVYKGEIK
jgi:DhnA family fructose-bisphosphate aldolase class Ia